MMQMLNPEDMSGIVIKSKKCNQCDYASPHTGHMSIHLKTHSGEKPNKCNQCDYASSEAGNLRRHLNTHGGEKSNWSDTWGEVIYLKLRIPCVIYLLSKYVAISTHVWFFTHVCGKIHILPRVQLCGFHHTGVFYCTYVWKKPNMCGKTHTGRCWVFSTHVW